MIQLPGIKVRLVRVEKLVKGLAAELAAWKDAKHPLTLMERQWYVGFLEQAQAAVKRHLAFPFSDSSISR